MKQISKIENGAKKKKRNSKVNFFFLTFKKGAAVPPTDVLSVVVCLLQVSF